MCSTPWSLNFSPSSVLPDGNEETDFFKKTQNMHQAPNAPAARFASPPLSTSGDQGLLPLAFLLGSEASLRAMPTAIVDPDQRNFVLSC